MDLLPSYLRQAKTQAFDPTIKGVLSAIWTQDAIDELTDLITNLGNINVKQTIWEEITAKGIDNTVNQFQGKTSVDTTIWDTSPYNSEAKKVNAGGSYTGEDIFTASGTHIKSIIDANGDYLLSGIPNPALYPRYSIVYVRKGTAKEFGEEGIPSSQILETIETSSMVRDVENAEVRPKNVGDNLNMETGGFKDFFVSIAIKLGEVGETAFNTIKKSIVGAVNENKLKKEVAIGTCLLWGGELSINAGDNTKFDIEAGSAQFEDDYTDSENPTSTIINWEKQIGISVTNISIQIATNISVNSSGVFLQNASGVPIEDLKKFLPLGTLIHANLTSLSDAVPVPIWGSSLMQTIGNIYGSLGFSINEFGNEYTANGSNLNINKSEGITGSNGINYGINKEDPNRKISDDLEALYFFTLYPNTPVPTLAFTNAVPNTHYDPNGDGTLVEIPEGFFATPRFYHEPISGITVMQYAQFVYDSLKKASTSWEQEVFLKDPLIERLPLRTVLAIQKNCTELNNADCTKFIQLGILGDKTLNIVDGFSDFAENIEDIDTMTYQRQAISYYDSGGVLYSDIAAEFNFERDDISFVNADSSINTAGGDFDNDSMIAGDKIIISGSTNNNGIFTIVSVATAKIIVSETVIDESAGDDIKIETPGKGNITFVIGQREFVLNCKTGIGRNGRARITLNEGTDENPQENWGYAIRSGNEMILQQSDSEQTSGSFSNMFSALIPSVATTIAKGFYNSRRWTDTKNVDGKGVISTILSKLRDITPYKSGLGANITIDTGPSPDSVDFTIEAGIVREIYLQNITAKQLSIDGAIIVNDFDEKYREITNLNEITKDSTGATLNNRYFQILCGLSLNADGYPDRIVIKVPNGSYGNAVNAFYDTKGFMDTSFPAEFKSVYLAFAGVFKLQGGTQISNEALAFGVNNIDLRTREPGASSSGAGTSAITTFSDGDFALYNNVDSTKRMVWDLSNVSTGQTRTITMTDRNLDLENPSFASLEVGLTGSPVHSNFLIGCTSLGKAWDGGAYFGETTGDRVVLGEFEGNATIGGHNSTLSGWVDLYLNPYGNVFTSNLNVASLTASQIVETDGSKLLVSVAKNSAYNKAFGSGSGNVAEGDAVVFDTGNQSIDGIKTFTSFPITPSSAPTTDYQVANKKYVDDNTGNPFDQDLNTTDSPTFNGLTASSVNIDGGTIDGLSHLAIGTNSPETAIDIVNTIPYITLHNNTHEDADGGRESKLIFKGEQSGGEISTLARIEVSHDGTGDDEKGKMVFYVNDGNDGNTPVERMRIDDAVVIEASTYFYSLQTYNHGETTQKGRDVYVQSSGRFVYDASTEEAKDNIVPIENWQRIYDLEPKQYQGRKRISDIRELEIGEKDDYTDECFDGIAFGNIAETIHLIFPELTLNYRDPIFDENGNVIDFKIVGYDEKGLIHPTILAVQDHRKILNEYDLKFIDIKKRLDNLENVA